MHSYSFTIPTYASPPDHLHTPFEFLHDRIFRGCARWTAALTKRAGTYCAPCIEQNRALLQAAPLNLWRTACVVSMERLVNAELNTAAQTRKAGGLSVGGTGACTGSALPMAAKPPSSLERVSAPSMARTGSAKRMGAQETHRKARYSLNRF